MRARLPDVLRLDAAANALAGLALAAVGGWLADPLGLTSAWPLRIGGLALAVYGLGNLLTARRMTPGGLRALIAVDLGFAAAVLAWAVADPTSAETWTRWGLVAVAALSATFGTAKIAGSRGLGPAKV